MRTNKKYFFIVIVFMSLCCESSKLLDNSNTIRKIDNLEFTKCSIRIEVDSHRNTIDTNSIIKEKYNIEGELIYKEREYKINDQEYLSKIYYWKNKVPFLERSRSKSGDFQYYSEVFKDENGLIKKLIGYGEFDGIRDSFSLDYEYKFSLNNTKTKLIMTSVSNEEPSKTIIEYDENEDAKSEVTLINNDTFEMKSFLYSNSKLTEFNSIKNSYDTIVSKTKYIYNDQGKLVSEIITSQKLDSLPTTSTMTYEYNTQDEWIGLFKFDGKLNKSTKLVINKITCD